jgi:hypothetical protein
MIKIKSKLLRIGGYEDDGHDEKLVRKCTHSVRQTLTFDLCEIFVVGISRVGIPHPVSSAGKNACRSLCKVPGIVVRFQPKLECFDRFYRNFQYQIS